jgi:hypothetical protein
MYVSQNVYGTTAGIFLLPLIINGKEFEIIASSRIWLV